MEMTKFILGDIWEDRLGNYYFIIDIGFGNYPILACVCRDREDGKDGKEPHISYTFQGYEIGAGTQSDLDLVRYIGNKESRPEYYL